MERGRAGGADKTQQRNSVPSSAAAPQPAEALPPARADPGGKGVWEPKRDGQSGKIFWTNHTMQRTVWEPPKAAHASPAAAHPEPAQASKKKKAAATPQKAEALPPVRADSGGKGVWEPKRDGQSGKIFWTNHTLQRTVWEPPKAPHASPAAAQEQAAQKEPEQPQPAQLQPAQPQQMSGKQQRDSGAAARKEESVAPAPTGDDGKKRDNAHSRWDKQVAKETAKAGSGEVMPHDTEKDGAGVVPAALAELQHRHSQEQRDSEAARPQADGDDARAEAEKGNVKEGQRRRDRPPENKKRSRSPALARARADPERSPEAFSRQSPRSRSRDRLRSRDGARRSPGSRRRSPRSRSRENRRSRDGGRRSPELSRRRRDRHESRERSIDRRKVEGRVRERVLVDAARQRVCCLFIAFARAFRYSAAASLGMS